MGQVRKDILNGWKEIGGYVCRDIRTVERWEKQRGLPVRRVPGAGRATVYALISEVDEWLARTGPNDDSGDNIPAQSVSSTTPHSEFTVDAAPAVDGTQPAAAVPVPAPILAPRTDVPSRLRPGSLLARFAIAGSAALLCVIVWPLMVQARHGRTRSEAPAGNSASTLPPGIPYRSRVAGVDDLYLRGIYFYEQRTPDSLQHSLENFQAAITKDPKYAPAYAGLANTYNLLRQYSAMPDGEAYPKAKAAAERAIALDPNLPQAHASLGFIDFFWSWDPTSAEKQFRTAIALDPNSMLAHHWYGSMLVHEGRYAEAIDQLDLAQRLEPTSVAILSIRALAVGWTGHRDEAVEMLDEVLHTAPTATSPHSVLATLSLMQPRDLKRFLDESTRCEELKHNTDQLRILAAARAALKSGGEKAMWSKMLAELQQMHPDKSQRTYGMAQAEAALGRNDQALADLQQLAGRRDPSVIGVLADPTLFPLRRDPRFAAVVATIGLPQPAAH